MLLRFVLVVLVVCSISASANYLPIPLSDSTYLSENTYQKMRKEIKENYSGKEKRLRKKVLKKWRQESKEKDGNITVVKIIKKSFPKLDEAQITGHGTFTFTANGNSYLASIAKHNDFGVATGHADLDLRASMLPKKKTVETNGNTTTYSQFSSGIISGYNPQTIIKKLPEHYLVIKYLDTKELK